LLSGELISRFVGPVSSKFGKRAAWQCSGRASSGFSVIEKSGC